SIRLALFNLLVVFLPVAGVLFLGNYEQNLEQTQIDSMQRQARLIVSMLQSSAKSRAALATMRFGDERIRILDPGGRVTADTGAPSVAEGEEESPARWNCVSRAGGAALSTPRHVPRPTRRP